MVGDGEVKDGGLGVDGRSGVSFVRTGLGWALNWVFELFGEER